MVVFPPAPTDDIEAFMECCGTFFTPLSWRLSAGAGKDQIDRFCELVQHPLPLLYLGYLRHFGTKGGCINIAFDGDSNLAGLISSYERKFANGTLPSNCVYISRPGIEQEITLDYSPTEPTLEPRVGQATHPPTFLACSFRNWLYRCVFASAAISRQSSGQQRFGKRGACLTSELRSALEFRGLSAHWFSDEFGWCMSGETGISLLGENRSSNQTVFYLAGPAPRPLHELAQWLAREFGFQVSEPVPRALSGRQDR